MGGGKLEEVEDFTVRILSGSQGVNFIVFVEDAQYSRHIHGRLGYDKRDLVQLVKRCLQSHTLSLLEREHLFHAFTIRDEVLLDSGVARLDLLFLKLLDVVGSSSVLPVLQGSSIGIFADIESHLSKLEKITQAEAQLPGHPDSFRCSVGCVFYRMSDAQ